MRKPSKRNTAESELPCAKWRFETIHVLKGALILDVNFKFLGAEPNFPIGLRGLSLGPRGQGGPAVEPQT